MGIIYGVSALVALILIIPLFIKKEYAVVKEILINKPTFWVFNYIKMMRNQDNFSVWASIDPDMKKEMKGLDGTVGCISSWESTHKNVGCGEQEILKITENERIDYELRFLKPFKSISQAYFITESVTDHKTTVKWGFDGKMNYPMNLMLLFMNMEKMIGKDFENGLSKLKTLLEQQDDI